MKNEPNPETTASGEPFPDDIFGHEEGRLIETIVGSAALAKACMDPFDYALRLRTGEVIDFEFAKVLNNEWVHLDLKKFDDQPLLNRIAYPAERGLDVRISDIVWVMDAPRGS